MQKSMGSAYSLPMFCTSVDLEGKVEIPGIIRGLAMEEQNTCVISEKSLFKDLLIACIYKSQASKI